MRILAKKGTFLASLAAVVGLTVGSFAFSQAVTFGAETDVLDGDPPSPVQSQFPQLGGSPTGAPPAAPIDPNSGGAGNSGAVGSDANALPSTGSGGYLDADSSSSLPYALVALAVAVALTGSLAWVNSRK